ncbi:hypothetical protein TYRP_000673 [Tyrophagus putrescentiae]|nr:hypothetical protein TYRP_000673 [Tyrophagus putrescentiae]
MAKFLKYSDCLIHQVKLSPSYRKQCIRPLQAASEWIQEQAIANMNKKSLTAKDTLHVVRATCCAYNRWEDCILSHLTEQCTQPSADVFPYLIHHGTLDMVRYFCSSLRYNHKDPEQCNPVDFTAPENFLPRGLHSTSIMSYIFSYRYKFVAFFCFY